MTTGIRRFVLKAALALALTAGVGAATAEARPPYWRALRYAYPAYNWAYSYPTYSSYYSGYPAWTGYSYPAYSSSYYGWPGYGYPAYYGDPAYYGYGYPYNGGGLSIGRFGISIGGLGGIEW